MKIIKEEAGVLIMRDKSWLAFLVGFVFMIFGVLFIFKSDVFINQPPLWGGVLTFIMGLLVICFWTVTTVIVDRKISKLTFSWKALVRHKIKEVSIGDIKHVELRQIYDLRNSRVFRVFVVLKSSEEIKLNKYGTYTSYGIGYSVKPKTEKDLGLKIATFINVPFLEIPLT